MENQRPPSDQNREKYFIDYNIFFTIKARVDMMMKMFYNGLEEKTLNEIDLAARNAIEKLIFTQLLDRVLAHIDPRLHDPFNINDFNPKHPKRKSDLDPESNFIYEPVHGPNKSHNYINAPDSVLNYIINYELSLPFLMLSTLRKNREVIREIINNLLDEIKDKNSIPTSRLEEDFIFKYKLARQSLLKEGKKLTQESIAIKMELNRREFQEKFKGFHLIWDAKDKSLCHLDEKPL